MKKVLIGLLIAGVLGIALLAGGGYFLWNLFDKSTVSAEDFQAVKVGSSKQQVLADLPDVVEFTEKDIYGSDTSQAEPVPDGADCEHFMSSDVSGESSGNSYYRFCYVDGALVEKKTVTP